MIWDSDGFVIEHALQFKIIMTHILQQIIKSKTEQHSGYSVFILYQLFNYLFVILLPVWEYAIRTVFNSVLKNFKISAAIFF